MNNLKIFENKEFGSIRTFEQDGKYLLCGTDVARALGYSIPSKAVNTHCKGVSKMEAPTSGGVQKLLFIPEGDVYRLIVHNFINRFLNPVQKSTCSNRRKIIKTFGQKCPKVTYPINLITE